MVEVGIEAKGSKGTGVGVVSGNLIVVGVVIMVFGFVDRNILGLNGCGSFKNWDIGGLLLRFLGLVDRNVTVLHGLIHRYMLGMRKAGFII